jgi:prophage regulatory protein
MEQSILRLADVMQLVRLSKSQIYALAARGEFPKPFKLSQRASGFDAEAVARWIESRKAPA